MEPISIIVGYILNKGLDIIKIIPEKLEEKAKKLLEEKLEVFFDKISTKEPEISEKTEEQIKTCVEYHKFNDTELQKLFEEIKGIANNEVLQDIDNNSGVNIGVGDFNNTSNKEENQIKVEGSNNSGLLNSGNIASLVINNHNIKSGSEVFENEEFMHLQIEETKDNENKTKKVIKFKLQKNLVFAIVIGFLFITASIFMHFLSSSIGEDGAITISVNNAKNINNDTVVRKVNVESVSQKTPKIPDNIKAKLIQNQK